MNDKAGASLSRGRTGTVSQAASAALFLPRRLPLPFSQTETDGSAVSNDPSVGALTDWLGKANQVRHKGSNPVPAAVFVWFNVSNRVHPLCPREKRIGDL